MFGKSASRGDDDRQFDPRRSVRTLCHGKAEPGAVANAGRDRHLDRMSNELEPAATACRAGFSPRFTAPTALDARALDRHAERDRDTVGGFAVGQLDDGTKRVGTLVSQERAPDTLDRRRHRRKVDDDFVREAVDVEARVVARHHRCPFAAVARVLRPVASMCMPPHRTGGTIGIARGEVNGRKGVSDVRRDHALA